MLTKPKILIVEDEPGIAETIQYALQTEGFVAQWCANAADALSAFRAQPPALAILDIGLPDLSGFELYRRLRALPQGMVVPVIFLTARNEEIDRVLGLELGADDYMAKPFSPRELVARVRGILRRSQGGSTPSDTLTSPGVTNSVGRTALMATSVIDIDDDKRQARFYGQLLDLTRYEYGVLRLLSRRPGRVYTRDELLAQVWGDASESIDRTVDAHIKTLRSKLKAVAPDAQAIRTLRGTGYAWAEDLPSTLGGKPI